MSKTPDPGLKVRVYNIAHQNFDGHQDLGNCVLSQLVPDAQDKIVAVKVDDDLLRATGDRDYNLQAYFSQLDRLNLGNCTEVLLASGGTVYMSEPEVAAQVRDRFFASQPDHCCRYGSLLVSSCTEGIANLDRPITVKIVDFEHENEMERKVAKDLRVGDCHGKISPCLAKILGGKENTPFQFRLANSSPNSPLPAFIAKGTVAIDSRRTENRGYDLVLDRSSIKGWANNTGPMKVAQINNQWRLTPKPNLNQQQLADLEYLPTIIQNQGVQYQIDPSDRSYILQQPSKQALDVLAHAYDWGRDRLACGVYQMPEVVLGNNSNAELQDYRNSWQLTQWYSPQAIEQDIVPATVAEAEYLKSIQNDYQLLAQYLVKNHDQKQKLKNLEEEEVEDKNEFGLIEVLRADTRGELANHPKIVSFCRDQLRKRWLELATKGANTLESAMAQPADIKPGTVIATHLISGTEVIVTRYPIINKDNIRRYVVDNEQISELIDTRGCVFINPDDAMRYHQCDFDGDQLVCTPCDLLPTIAAETRTARVQLDAEGNDINRDFNPVVKKQKKAYPQSDLKHMALAVRLNSIGRIANAIGRVNCSQPNPDADIQDQQYFVKFKRELMDVLFDSLQVEVDSPKSSSRYTDYYPDLNRRLNSQAFALPFFDFKQDDRVFSSAPMPVPENGSVVDILPRHINQIWESCELKEMPVSQYKHLLQNQDSNLDDTAKAAIARLSSNILQQYNDNVKLIVREKVSDSQQIKERFARTYAEIKEQIMTAQLSSVAKDELAATLWQKQHNNSSETSCRRKCINICRHFDPSIYTYQKEKHQYRRDLIKDQPAYIVEAPFESSLFASQGRKDCAVYIKEMLDAQSQDFEATVHPSKPCVVFAIKNIAPHVKQLFEPFHDPQTARHHDLIDLKQARQSLFNSDRQLYNKLFTFTSGTKKYNPLSIVAPRHMNWLMGQTSRKASLVFSVLPERVSQALGREISQVQLLGKDKNAYAQHDFNSAYYQGRQLNFFVSTFNDPNSDRHGDPMVYMQNPGDGNYYSLGMFAQDSNKLPVSANFKAQATSDGKTVELSIEPGSIIVPHKELPKSPKKLRSKARRREVATTQRSNQDRISSILNKRREYRKSLPKQQRQIQSDRPDDPQPDRNQLEI
ncbi:hypothetical protein [Myxosarcina sp. GI1]|uniref:hypothetical protein n=1 Tax=Myxosarcina sp. GI1 TaxID=1541065 RepID=UPI0005695229|nr:hypothetical protein [Myxosarcina sp. GI1]